MFLRNILAAAEISAIYVRMKRRMETGWGDFHLFLSLYLSHSPSSNMEDREIRKGNKGHKRWKKRKRKKSAEKEEEE